MNGFGDDDFMSPDFPGLITSLQQNDLKAFEEAQQIEREKLQALRAQQPNQGLTLSELMQDGDDPEKKLARLNAELDKMNADAADAARKVTDATELPPDRFPPPPTTV